MQNSIDVLYMVFPGHHLMPLARWLTRRRLTPVVLDIFISLYETDVEDRARVGAWHPKAWMLWCIDWLACKLADIILIDTEEHRDYFVRRYRISQDKFLIIPVGARTDIFSPQTSQTQKETFVVHFYGSFIPLHGIETILRAAEELRQENIIFTITGRGQIYPAMRSLAEKLALNNVTFLDPVPLDDLPRRIADAHVSLGIFGTSGKALRVIPTKAYEILAMGKPLITARTPASSRALRDREDALLVEPGDAHDLAEKIRELKSNPQLAQHIAENGHALFLRKFQPHIVVEPLVQWLHAHSTK